ncbi:uncharacterized protein LOC125721162 [Brienomyrus brachyistius]|uniref:uncharacterized protein LOC125721162 n=1 Tax=Brienomyrus brachyistius TaxID=42636 RepID=UPI0020B2EE3B|nr:uncharacterized protein LOC125721162 [Brienomyrus brachyistius]
MNPLLENSCDAIFKLKLGLLNIRSLAPKALLINEIITDFSLGALCLTETWLKPDEFMALNESTPAEYSYKHNPRPNRKGGGVAAIFQSNLGVSEKCGVSFSTFETLVLSLAGSSLSSSSPQITMVIVYRLHRPYSDFLKEFADFLTNLVVSTDKAVIVGDFNIHMEKDNDPLKIAFAAILDSVGVCQNVVGPTHVCNHTLDLIISHGILVEHVSIMPQSPLLSDHYLLTFEIQYSLLLTTTPKYRIRRSIKALTTTTFMKQLPQSFSLTSEASCVNELEQATSNMEKSLRSTLDLVAPLRRIKHSNNKPAPWYSDNTSELKQPSRKLERKWHSTKLEVFKSAWKESLSKYRQALVTARLCISPD